jgi:L-alanine-DL-glutamate epimerase-like enolase superfamily enzyme
VELRVTRSTLRFAVPLRTSYGEVADRELFTVELDAGGVAGIGEAAPLEAYDGVPAAAVAAALARYAEVVRELPAGAPGHEVLDACRAAADLPEALAAVDLALWDRAGKRAGRPVAALLRDGPLGAVTVNATIGALDRAGGPGRRGAAAGRGIRLREAQGRVGGDVAGRVARRGAAARAGGAGACGSTATGRGRSRRRCGMIARLAAPRARARRGARARHRGHSGGCARGCPCGSPSSRPPRRPGRPDRRGGRRGSA